MWGGRPPPPSRPTITTSSMVVCSIAGPGIRRAVTVRRGDDPHSIPIGDVRGAVRRARHERSRLYSRAYPGGCGVGGSSRWYRSRVLDIPWRRRPITIRLTLFLPVMMMARGPARGVRRRRRVAWPPWTADPPPEDGTAAASSGARSAGVRAIGAASKAATGATGAPRPRASATTTDASRLSCSPRSRRETTTEGPTTA